LIKYIFTFLFVITFSAKAEDKLPELKVEKVTDGVYLHKSYSRVVGFGLVSSNGLVVINNKKALIIDTPWSNGDTEKLIKWIEGKHYKVVGSLSTHSHDDRTAGIEWLNRNAIPTYASQMTNEFLEKEGKAQAIKSFDSIEFELHDGAVQAFYPGKGHAADNIVVWLPKSKILFGGCMIRSLKSKSLGYTGEASIEDWPISTQKVIDKYPHVKLVVPGHGGIAGPEMLKHTQELAREGLAEVKPN